MWKILKSMIGKDITKFAVPVYLNEPISMIQKIAEIMEYEEALVTADQESDQMLRLIHVSVFGVAQYACSARRTGKPFNPILGETFEYKCPKFKYIGEQVSHHPPISAAHVESDAYEFSMQTETKLNLTFGSLKATPIGLQHIRLKSTGEHYTIFRPNSHVKNLVFGQTYIE